jgi:prepilin-type N-terminal cleavage/methylation domain-containing protein
MSPQAPPPASARAFTLIELLVVIAIIGILASLLFIAHNVTAANSRDLQWVQERTSVPR